MHDQANALRGLMERQTLAGSNGTASALRGKHCHTVTLTSGKGGVGKSNVALNLAIALAKAGQSVLVQDVNWGVSHLDLLCGISSPWNLSHVVGGSRTLEEVIVDGPCGVQILSGVESLTATDDPTVAEDTFAQLMAHQHQFDFVINDLGAGIPRFLPQFVSLADRVIVVTTTEPPSIADAYATIKTLSGKNESQWEVLINQVETAAQAETIYQKLQQTTKFFLQKELGLAGSILLGPEVGLAVTKRKPFLLEHPNCLASQAIKQLARKLINQLDNPRQSGKSSNQLLDHSNPNQSFPETQTITAS